MYVVRVYQEIKENSKALLNVDIFNDLQQLFKFKYEYYVNNLLYES